MWSSSFAVLNNSHIEKNSLVRQHSQTVMLADQKRQNGVERQETKIRCYSFRTARTIQVSNMKLYQKNFRSIQCGARLCSTTQLFAFCQ